jgi:hypothetical protein
MYVTPRILHSCSQQGTLHKPLLETSSKFGVYPSSKYIATVSQAVTRWYAVWRVVTRCAVFFIPYWADTWHHACHNCELVTLRGVTHCYAVIKDGTRCDSWYACDTTHVTYGPLVIWLACIHARSYALWRVVTRCDALWRGVTRCYAVWRVMYT